MLEWPVGHISVMRKIAQSVCLTTSGSQTQVRVLLSYMDSVLLFCVIVTIPKKVLIVCYLNASCMLDIVVSILGALSHLILTAINELDIVSMLQMRKPSLRDVWGLAQYHTIRK